MKKLVLAASVLGLVAAASTAAYAGFKSTWPTTIFTYPTYSVAFGSIGSTRNTADNIQYIGCEMYANNSYSVMQCFARDATGKYLSCYNRVNQGMKDSVAAISDTSLINFQTDPADQTKCGFVQITTGSYTAEPPL